MFKATSEQNTVVYDSSAQTRYFFKDVFDSGKGKGIVATVAHSLAMEQPQFLIRQAVQKDTARCMTHLTQK